MEKWKDVVDYEGLYQVSDLGQIRSVDRVVPHGSSGGVRQLRGRVLNGNLNSSGYLNVNLSSEGIQTSHRVHRLVAEAWLGSKPEGLVIRHGSKGRLDNSVVNLSYGTQSEALLTRRSNGTHGGRAVKRSDGKVYISLTLAAEDVKCNVSNILKVCNGTRKSAGGFNWEFNNG